MIDKEKAGQYNESNSCKGLETEMEYYAHKRELPDGRTELQTVSDHLQKTADRAVTAGCDGAGRGGLLQSGKGGRPADQCHQEFE